MILDLLIYDYKRFGGLAEHDQADLAKQELAQLRADLAAATIEITSERQRYADLISSAILETGVDVPISGMTVYEAIRALRATLATREAECARLQEMLGKIEHEIDDCELFGNLTGSARGVALACRKIARACRATEGVDDDTQF